MLKFKHKQPSYNYCTALISIINEFGTVKIICAF